MQMNLLSNFLAPSLKKRGLHYYKPPFFYNDTLKEIIKLEPAATIPEE